MANVAVGTKFLNPEEIINDLGIAKENIIADFGCGSGYFSIPIAKLATEGMVHSLDVLPSALESVTSRAKMEGLSNVVATRVNLEKEGGSKLAGDSIDWVILKDMLFQNKGKNVILQEALRVLKPGGKALIIEWNKKDSGIGPVETMKVSEAELESLIQSQGFRIEKKMEFGDLHFGFIAQK